MALVAVTRAEAATAQVCFKRFPHSDSFVDSFAVVVTASFVVFPFVEVANRIFLVLGTVGTLSAVVSVVDVTPDSADVTPTVKLLLRR